MCTDPDADAIPSCDPYGTRSDVDTDPDGYVDCRSDANTTGSDVDTFAYAHGYSKFLYGFVSMHKRGMYRQFAKMRRRRGGRTRLYFRMYPNGDCDARANTNRAGSDTHTDCHANPDRSVSY